MISEASGSAKLFYSSILMSLSLLVSLMFNGEHIYFLSLTWLTLVLWTVYQMSQLERIRLPYDWLLIVVALFVIWMLLAICMTPVKWLGEYLNWRVGVFFYVLVASYLLCRVSEHESIINRLAVFGVIIAALSLFQVYYLGETAHGLFNNKNNNAAFLNLFLLPQMSLLLFSRGMLKNTWFNQVAIIITLFTVLQIASRGAYISLFIAAIILLGWAIYKKRWRNTIYVGLLIVFIFFMDHVFSNVEVRGDLQSQSRMYLWSSAIEMLRDANWHGIGNGMFMLSYPAYRHIEEMSGGLYVHNDYLQIMLELGVPGIAFLLLIMAGITLKLVNIARDDKSNADTGLYFGLFAGLVSVSVHSMVTFNFYLTSILIVCGLYSGLIIARSKQMVSVSLYEYTAHLSKPWVVVVFLFLLLSINSILRMGYADGIADGFIGADADESTLVEKYQLFDNLHKLDSTKSSYLVIMAIINSKVGENEDAIERAARLDHSLYLLHKARSLNPYSQLSYISEAALLLDYKDIADHDLNEGVISLTNKALTLNPRSHRLRLRLAKLLVMYNKKDEALELLLEGLEHTRGMRKSYFEYGSQLSKELGQLEAIHRFSSKITEIEAREKEEMKEMINEALSNNK